MPVYLSDDKINIDLGNGLACGISATEIDIGQVLPVAFSVSSLQWHNRIFMTSRITGKSGGFFFNSLWRLTPDKTTNPALLALCEENPPGRASYAGSISMSWRMNIHSPVICSIQSSVVITRSNIVKYYIHNYRTWSRISIRCWIHKRHPIPRPNGRAMGCFCGYLWENWPRYNGTRLYL